MNEQFKEAMPECGTTIISEIVILNDFVDQLQRRRVEEMKAPSTTAYIMSNTTDKPI